MKKAEFLKSFSELKASDQEEVRAELVGRDAMAICKEMMERVKSGENAMACCEDMMSKMEEKCGCGCS